ncbi:Nif3-like dinuclear metal center hexameric protein [Helicobacter turcicus]|uniref:Nif3-like dinuclear metal center hexameric protein n=1 Tax=Helicobacter turcicus TaxID=2867412 RepID=A0ABS7JLM8_9HELI|nr:Nif3-like dinuclear metal center hexameric protein [Helicobacter turcicus]MBX7490297.1 Nif3-like dinuclear metal center hexameric protein [Helicobacter turcicus]MBX7545124.1 Nif3-like dinuclear metal center hexameric protein [Helicobacter turcicus]
MQTFELLEILDSISPFALQEKWDNSGLILGAPNAEFRQIYLSLEATLEILEKLESNSLLITHHPLIFSPLKSLNFTQYPAKLLECAIKKEIQLIAMHTNFDKTHFGDYVVREKLGIRTYEKENFAVRFLWNDSIDSLLKHIKEKFTIPFLKFTQGNFKKPQRVALITGSGGSFVGELSEMDCLITGDVKYHEAMEAQALGINIIDCGHYELECYFGEILSQILTNHGYKAIISNSQNPFNFV